MALSKKFRKGVKVIIIVDRNNGTYETVEATYDRSFGSCYHQAITADGDIIQCDSNHITRA